MKRGSWAILLLYLFCAVYLVPVYPHYVSANELAHWVIDASLVEHGTLDTRWSEPLIGKLVDSTARGAAIYSNKPPGLALVSAPGYLVVRLLGGPPNPHNLRWYLYAMRLVGATLPVAVLVMLPAWRRRATPFATAALLFGTCLFFYGALLFAHTLAALLVYAAYRALFPGGEPETPRGAVAAGALAGFATLTDYPAALAVIVFAGALLVWRRRRLAFFLLGGAPFALLFAAFNWVMFRSVFTLSRSHEAFASNIAYTSRGLWGLSIPSLPALWTVILSPSRGLLFYSPVLLLAIPALRPRDAAGWTRIALIAAALLFLASYSASDGGWGAGTRYLVFIVPIVAEAIPLPTARSGALGSGLLVLSAVLCVFPALTFLFAPPEFPWVHSTFLRPLLAKGFYMPNLGALAADTPLTLVPVVAAAAAAIGFAVRGGGPAAARGALLGAAASAIVVFFPAKLSPFLLVERQVVSETYFRPVGEVAAAARQVRNPALADQLAQVAASIDAARRYPPDDWPYRR